MLLVVDVGNTQTSYGLFDGDNFLAHWRSETKINRTQDEYATMLDSWMNFRNSKLTDICGVALCSVVPQIRMEWDAFCLKYLKCQSFHIHSGIDFDFKLDLDRADEVGADRLANVAFAVKNLALPAAVIDIGTATTIDVVGADAVYLGGIIFPGLQMASTSLGDRTAKLPKIDLVFPETVIGKNTVHCIQSGLMHGYSSMLVGMLKKIEDEIGVFSSIALTGGTGFLFQNQLQRQVQFLPDLTLYGIALLYHRNSKLLC